MNAKETLKEIRTMLGFSDEPVAVELATATLTDGTVINYEGELAIGTAVFVQTAEGDIPAPDATHELEGGMLVTTVDGIVTEIVEPEVEIEVEAEEFATVSAFNEVVAKMETAIAELTAKVATLTASNNNHKEAMSKAIDLIEKVADLPSEEPTKTPVSNKKNDQFEALKRLKNSLNK
jgi:molybdopterin converting factor small subunit